MMGFAGSFNRNPSGSRPDASAILRLCHCMTAGGRERAGILPPHPGRGSGLDPWEPCIGRTPEDRASFMPARASQASDGNPLRLSRA